MMHNSGPSSDMLMFQAVLFWIVSWWLAELVDGDPMGTAVAAVCATMALSFSIGSARHAVILNAHSAHLVFRILWWARPRKWMMAWGLIIALVATFGRPMILGNYGGGVCEYVDWWFTSRTVAAHGDGSFAGCRAIVFGSD